MELRGKSLEELEELRLTVMQEQIGHLREALIGLAETVRILAERQGYYLAPLKFPK